MSRTVHMCEGWTCCFLILNVNDAASGLAHGVCQSSSRRGRLEGVSPMLKSEALWDARLWLQGLESVGGAIIKM